MKLEDKVLLRKRFITETVNDQLKNISQRTRPNGLLAGAVHATLCPF